MTLHVPPPHALRLRVLIVENDLCKARLMAQALEDTGATIAGMTTDMTDALAIATGEQADCAALHRHSAHGKTGIMLRACLGLPVIRVP